MWWKLYSVQICASKHCTIVHCTRIWCQETMVIVGRVCPSLSCIIEPSMDLSQLLWCGLYSISYTCSHVHLLWQAVCTVIVIRDNCSEENGFCGKTRCIHHYSKSLGPLMRYWSGLYMYSISYMKSSSSIRREWIGFVELLWDESVNWRQWLLLWEESVHHYSLHWEQQ